MDRKEQNGLSEIKLLLMDVDGVLTDGGIIINSDGTEGKVFCAYDGHRIKMWHRAGLKSAIISGRDTQATAIRAGQLAIVHVMQGCTEKLPAFEEILKKTDTTAEQTAYIGDDMVDIPVMRRAGFAVAVANAAEQLKEHADYVTTRQGGHGAVGEVIEHILKITGRWQELLEKYTA